MSADDESRFIVVRRRENEVEYARGDFGQVFVPQREMATEYPAEVIASEVARVWGSYGDGWMYSAEKVTT